MGNVKKERRKKGGVHLQGAGLRLGAEPEILVWEAQVVMLIY